MHFDLQQKKPSSRMFRVSAVVHEVDCYVNAADVFGMLCWS